MTRTVILSNCIGCLRTALRNVDGPLRYLSLVDTEASFRIRASLRERGDAVELPRGEFFCQRRDRFRSRYVEFLGAVNEANHSRFWWAMPFTTKNPLATPLCRDTFNFLLIADLATEDERPLVVITDSRHLAAQMRMWGQAEGVQVLDRVRTSGRWWRRLLKRVSPALFALTTGRILWLWLRVRRYAPAPDDRPSVAVTSLLHSHSFTPDGSYRDAYFGSLIDFLAARGQPAFVFAMILERPGEWLASRLRRLRSSLPVIPVEACLSAGELLRCLLHATARYVRPFRLTGPTEIEGRDVRCLLERSIREACRGGTFLAHLRIYYCSRSLARTVKLDRCLYPYENRAFEKMLLTGIREVSPATRLIGYNHASITLSHTNFILGRGEAKVMPLPDTILTLGHVVRDWLEAEGNYPPGIFRSACALRQNRTAVPPPRMRRGPIRDVLVPLATSLEEYVNTLVLLDVGFRDAPAYHVRIRPHPTIRIEDALRVAPLGRRNFFTEDRMPLAQSLAQVDVVLYASSTVGLEAVSLGIPTIYLDLDDFLDTDPMIGWGEFKWTVRRPEELVPTLCEIDAIPDDRFRLLQVRGQEYAVRYLCSVTESNLQVFLDA